MSKKTPVVKDKEETLSLQGIKKFGKRQSVHDMLSLPGNSGKVRKSGKIVNKASPRESSYYSGNAKSSKEKISTKRKGSDEVDGSCSPPKLSKTDVSQNINKYKKGTKIVDNPLRLNNQKRINSSEGNEKYRILGDEPGKNNLKQKKSCRKEKIKTELNPSSIGLCDKHGPTEQSKEKTLKKQKSKLSENPAGDKNKLHSVKKKSSQKSRKTGVKDPFINSNGETGSSTSKETDPSDPFAILMMMEGRPAAPQLVSPSLVASDVTLKEEDTCPDMDSSGDQMNEDSDGSEQLSDWEDVQEHPIPDAFTKSQLPDKPVEITMALPEILKKKKKKCFDWKAYLEQRVRRFQKEVAANMHKTHLLCLVASGLRQNAILNEPTLTAVILSTIPKDLTRKRGGSEEKQVETLMSWYKKKFPLEQITHASQNRLVSVSSLMKAVCQSCISDARMWVLVFISLLRTLGFQVRLILSFQPMPFKPDSMANHKSPSPKGKQSSKGTVKCKGKAQNNNPASDNVKKMKMSEKSTKPASSSSSKSKYFKPSSKNSSPCTPSSSQSLSSSLRKQSSRRSKEEANLKSKQNLKDEENDIFTDDEEEDFGAAREKLKKKQKVTKKVDKEKDNHYNSDSEFEGSPSLRLKKDLKIKSNRRILSASSEDDFECSSQGPPDVSSAHDFWMELYVTSKKSWICFDCFKAQFGKPYALELSATQPLSYVVGFRNDNSIKDLTSRYAKQWLSQTRKHRVDVDWITNTFSLFDFSTYNERILEEDDIKSQLLVRPMPTTIGDFKNHPLYALRRHLLKFEAIYPDTAIPVGYMKKEPIYARECVRLLHSRHNWLKEGRLVRLKEEPYKMVKSRPQKNKPKENPDELDLELFGEWQTEKYIPPPAVNGKVPKNDYGNVELFQPWMLPQGTVHLKVQGLQRVAKKLGIDVAAAMIGWDYHGGSSHPVMDGWVVCEEFADTLLEAWDDDQENQRQREEEKRDKRVYGNWKRLIRGLLIKERLKNKFLMEKALTTTSQKLEEEDDEEVDFSSAPSALPAEQFWPLNRQEEEKTEQTEKAQENRRQLNKEREKRKSELKERVANLDTVAQRDKRASVKKTNPTVVNKPNADHGKGSRSKTNKRRSKKIETFTESDEDSSETDDEDDDVKDTGSNKQKNDSKLMKKASRKRTKEQEDEDETYVPSGKINNNKLEESAETCSRKSMGRETRSRRRCV